MNDKTSKWKGIRHTRYSLRIETYIDLSLNNHLFITSSIRTKHTTMLNTKITTVPKTYSNNNTRTHVQLWTLNPCKSPDILCRLFSRKPAESVACYSKLGTPIWEFKKKFMFLWGFKAQPNNKRSPALLTNQWESGELYIMPVLWFISHVGVHHKSFITDGWCSLRQYCLWTRNSEVIR